MIGATDGDELWPAWFTNFGQRVDLNGWGLNVVTCAYGDLQDGEETEWYTAFFSGTSSASPIVTGAVASLQGMVEASFGFSLDANLARTILVATGTPVGGDQQIGPRPDLEAAWTLASAGVGMISGTVIETPGGAPIAGAEIRVLPDGPRTTTADDGTYRLGLLPGDYQLHFSSYLHGELTTTLTVTSGDNPLITELTPLPLETIEGTVFDPAFTPLAGARLALIDEPVRAVESGADGTFAFAPVIYLLYPIPKVVFVPIILLFLGINDISKIAIIFLILFFQILVVVRDQAAAITPELIYSVRSLGAGRRGLFRCCLWAWLACF